MRLQAQLTTPIAIIDITVNSLFLTDVLINFKTAYYGASGSVDMASKNMLCSARHPHGAAWPTF
jgi:hypothetical protein